MRTWYYRSLVAEESDKPSTGPCINCRHSPSLLLLLLLLLSALLVAAAVPAPAAAAPASMAVPCCAAVFTRFSISCAMSESMPMGSATMQSTPGCAAAASAARAGMSCCGREGGAAQELVGVGHGRSAAHTDGADA